MNKDILNFNKEIALEVRKIIKKTQDFTKELILKSAKEKGLCLEVLNEGECTQSYLVKNVEYILELIENEKIKCTSKMGNKFGLAYKTYTFEDLLIIENLNKNIKGQEFARGEKRLLYSNFKRRNYQLKQLRVRF